MGSYLTPEKHSGENGGRASSPAGECFPRDPGARAKTVNRALQQRPTTEHKRTLRQNRWGPALRDTRPPGAPQEPWKGSRDSGAGQAQHRTAVAATASRPQQRCDSGEARTRRTVRHERTDGPLRSDGEAGGRLALPGDLKRPAAGP